MLPSGSDDALASKVTRHGAAPVPGMVVNRAVGAAPPPTCARTVTVLEVAAVKPGVTIDAIHDLVVRKLVEAKDLYVNGYAEALPHIARELKALVEFYPGHIETEDKRFFFPCLAYFTQAEQERMLEEFHSFDRNMIHEKYRLLVENFLGKRVKRPSVAG